MNSKHTPGPWSGQPARTNDGRNGITIMGNDERGNRNVPVAEVDEPYFGNLRTVREWEANARLIAASPDLLAILDWVEATAVNLHCSLQATAAMDPNDARIAVETGRVVKDLIVLRDRARAAIARATG